MAKYAVHTKWEWPNGVPSADTMQGWHREFKSQTKAEDIIWFKIDENTHQSVIIFSSEEDAKSELEMRQSSVSSQLMKQDIKWSKKQWDQFYP